MNRKKIIFSVLLITLVAALVIGGTAAWFTAKAEVENEFTAGTVMINVGEVVSYGEEIATNMDNVNPGDCFNKKFTVTNTGSKYFLLRLKLTELWEFDREYLIDNYYALCYTESQLYVPTEANIDAIISAAVNPVIWDDILDDEENVIKKGIITQLKEHGWIYLPVDPVDLYDDGYSYGYWYYDNNSTTTPGNGSFAPDSVGTLTFAFDVCFDGETMTNAFQAADYTLTIRFEAIQASNNASGSVWLVNSVYDPETPQSGAYWSDWGAPLKTVNVE